MMIFSDQLILTILDYFFKMLVFRLEPVVVQRLKSLFLDQDIFLSGFCIEVEMQGKT